MTESTYEITWVTRTIDTAIETSSIEHLVWEGTRFFSVTVVPSPSLELLVESDDFRLPLFTITGGAEPRWVGELAVSLQTSPSPAILWSVLATTTGESTNPSLSSASSTTNRPTTTTKPPRSTRTSRPNPTRNRKSKPGVGSGAIAGIAIAGIVILALIIGGWYFWRRKKRRAQPPAATLTEDELARREGDGDKMVLDTDHNATRTGADQTDYQEMSGNGLTQELDRSHSYKHAIGGAHELRAEDQPGELPYNGMEEYRRAHEAGVVGTHDGGDGGDMEMIPASGARDATAQVSPHVEAQRKREVEWLEMEETRMRQRREALLQQGGGQHT